MSATRRHVSGRFVTEEPILLFASDGVGLAAIIAIQTCESFQ